MPYPTDSFSGHHDSLTASFKTSFPSSYHDGHQPNSGHLVHELHRPPTMPVPEHRPFEANASMRNGPYVHQYSGRYGVRPLARVVIDGFIAALSFQEGKPQSIHILYVNRRTPTHCCCRACLPMTSPVMSQWCFRFIQTRTHRPLCSPPAPLSMHTYMPSVSSSGYTGYVFFSC